MIPSCAGRIGWVYETYRDFDGRRRLPRLECGHPSGGEKGNRPAWLECGGRQERLAWVTHGEIEELTLDSVSGILPKGGTILRTSRVNPLDNSDGPRRVLDNLKRFRIEAMIVVGGRTHSGSHTNSPRWGSAWSEFQDDR